ncbi:quinone oxidoreductase pig3, partial [Quercus suber]
MSVSKTPNSKAVCKVNAQKMKAMVISSPGWPEVLQLQEVDEPELKDDEVLIKVEASGLNQADTVQRSGAYPPPKGASHYLGVECSGTTLALGKSVSRWKIGDQDAASLPEVVCTVWSTVFMMSQLSAGETFLVHGGSSGIGTFAIQITKYYGARVFVTAGSDEKLAVCKDLGADVCINYKTEDFVKRVKEETDGKGVDVIQDHIGASYLKQNLESLNFDGRLFIIGTMGGSVTEVDLRALLSKRLTVQSAGLRYRSPENKAVIVCEVEKNVWPAIVAGRQRLTSSWKAVVTLEGYCLSLNSVDDLVAQMDDDM